MEGYVYYVADKLYTMRYGKERSVDICNFDIWTWRCWSSALREYFATTLFACVATLSTIPIGGSTPSDIRVCIVPLYQSGRVVMALGKMICYNYNNRVSHAADIKVCAMYCTTIHIGGITLSDIMLCYILLLG